MKFGHFLSNSHKPGNFLEGGLGSRGSTRLLEIAGSSQSVGRGCCVFRSVLAIVSLLFLPNKPAFCDSPIPVGPSFRVEAEMFVGDSSEPNLRHKILFDSGVVYDIHELDGRYTTIFDVARDRVLLLDNLEKTRAEIHTDQLIQTTRRLNLALNQAGKAEACGLTAKPVQLEEAKFSIDFGPVRYEMTTQPVSDPEIARAYHEMVVWAARLNVFQKRGLPPFARLALGELVAETQQIPMNVTLTNAINEKPQSFRAHQLVIERLSKLDRKAIDQVGDQLATYRKVDPSSFSENLDTPKTPR